VNESAATSCLPNLFFDVMCIPAVFIIYEFACGIGYRTYDIHKSRQQR
jgi:hypothetical protein